MNEDTTKTMTTDDKLNLLLSEVASIKTELTSVKTDFGTRLSRLEAIAEDRARDTRPLLGQLHQEIAETRAELRDLRGEVQALREEARADVQGLREEVRADVQGLREEVRADIKGVKEQLERLDFKLEYFNKEVLEMRTDHGLLKQRVTKLERQAA